MELVAKALESRCNQHGYIHPDDARDVLTDVCDDLAPEDDQEQPEPDEKNE